MGKMKDIAITFNPQADRIIALMKKVYRLEMTVSQFAGQLRSIADELDSDSTSSKQDSNGATRLNARTRDNFEKAWKKISSIAPDQMSALCRQASVEYHSNATRFSDNEIQTLLTLIMTIPAEKESPLYNAFVTFYGDYFV